MKKLLIIILIITILFSAVEAWGFSNFQHQMNKCLAYYNSLPLVVYLKDGSNNDLDKLYADVLSLNGVESVVKVTKEEAWQEFKDRHPDAAIQKAIEETNENLALAYLKVYKDSRINIDQLENDITLTAAKEGIGIRIYKVKIIETLKKINFDWMRPLNYSETFNYCTQS